MKTVVKDKREEYLLDSSLECYSLDEINNVFSIALICLEPEPSKRPTMAEVVKMLEQKMAGEIYIWLLISHNFKYSRKPTPLFCFIVILISAIFWLILLDLPMEGNKFEIYFLSRKTPPLYIWHEIPDSIQQEIIMIFRQLKQIIWPINWTVHQQIQIPHTSL